MPIQGFEQILEERLGHEIGTQDVASARRNIGCNRGYCIECKYLNWGVNKRLICYNILNCRLQSGYFIDL